MHKVDVAMVPTTIALCSTGTALALAQPASVWLPRPCGRAQEQGGTCAGAWVVCRVLRLVVFALCSNVNAEPPLRASDDRQ